MYYLKGTVITGGMILKDSYIEVINGKITYVGTEMHKKYIPVKRVREAFITPGFVDIHIHGIDNIDFMDESEEVYGRISKELPKYGVTSFLATSRTARLIDVTRFLDSAQRFENKDLNAKLLGVHLEGPWISPEYSGAQSESSIRKLLWNDVIKVIKPYADLISKITLAPEELDDLQIIKTLNSLDIQVSAGHTNATMEEIGRAMEYGLNQITHTFNAMSPFHHRRPGTSAAAMYYKDLICEVITDGVHVHPMIIELLYKLKGKERIALISDCTGYNQLPYGEYELRGKELVRSGNKVTLKNGKLAGSIITLDQGVKYVVNNCGISLEDAIFMVTETPLLATGKEKKVGKIEEGYDADFVILDKELNVRETIVDGQLLYSK